MNAKTQNLKLFDRFAVVFAFWHTSTLDRKFMTCFHVLKDIFFFMQHHTCMIFPMQTVHNKTGLSKKFWISVEAVKLQIAAIVVDDDFGSCKLRKITLHNYLKSQKI